MTQNINKTLHRENEEISTNTLVTQDLMKTLIDTRKALEDKREIQKRLVGHLSSQKEMKEVIDEKVDIAYKDIEKSAADVHEKLIEGLISSPLRKPEKNERRKNSIDSVDDMNETITKTQELKAIDSNPTKFHDFLFGISKNDELKVFFKLNTIIIVGLSREKF